MNNIFICYTPLHILIAKRIISEKNINKFYFIYLYDRKSPVNDYYFNLLSNKADKSFSVKLRKRSMFSIFTLINVFNEFKELTDCRIFTGNIKKYTSRSLALLFKYKEIITFDDGSGNISGQGYFYSENESLLTKMLFFVVDKKLLYKNLLTSSRTHYSIYKFKNVYENSEYIPLLKIKNNCPNKSRGIKTILLTNAFAEDNEVSLKNEQNLYKEILNKYNIDYILKHPREYLNKKLNISKYYKGTMIAEDFIQEVYKDNDIILIGSYSSTMFSFLSIKGIKVINADIKLKKPLKKISQIFYQHGVTFI